MGSVRRVLLLSVALAVVTLPSAQGLETTRAESENSDVCLSVGSYPDNIGVSPGTCSGIARGIACILADVCN